MTNIRSRILAAVAVGAAGLCGAGAASAADTADTTPFHNPNYTFPSGFPGFRLASHGGPFNPGVLVGFNPQPDPPGDVTRISLLDPTRPTMQSPTDGGAFDFLIALLDLGDGSVLPAVQAPNSDGFTGFDTDVNGHHIVMQFQFGGSEITSWSWGAFNPQPDPPGDWGGGVIGFAADPFMSFRLIVDDHLESFTLASAPEPATWALMLTGFFGAGAALRSRRRATASV